jgi:hypothetical protein
MENKRDEILENWYLPTRVSPVVMGRIFLMILSLNPAETLKNAGKG